MELLGSRLLFSLALLQTSIMSLATPPTLIISIIPIPKFTNNHEDVNDRKGPFDVKKTVYVLQPIGLELPEMNIPLPHHHQLYQQVTLLHHQLYQ